MNSETQNTENRDTMWSPCSNLDRLLDCITPVLPSFSLPKSEARGVNVSWQQSDKGKFEYFTMGDLWKYYTGISIYGAGVELVMPDGEVVTQYFIPHLSAIQLYTTKSVSLGRNLKSDSDTIGSENDSWSDDSANGKILNSQDSSKSWENISDDELESPRLGHLYFEYLEQTNPWVRVPLSKKINELAQNHPGLMTLRSLDLSPASWVAISWYPIYNIPSRNDVKDLSSCFVSYHTLSSSFLDSMDGFNVATEQVQGSGKGKEVIADANAEKENLSLPPFGLINYKISGDVYKERDTFDAENLTKLTKTAGSWLKQLKVSHHDFDFFKARKNV